MEGWQGSAAKTLSRSFCHPLRYAPGFGYIIRFTQGSAADAAPPWAIIVPPSPRAQNSSGFQPDKFPSIEMRGGFFENVIDVSIAYKILGTHVDKFVNYNEPA